MSLLPKIVKSQYVLAGNLIYLLFSLLAWIISFLVSNAVSCSSLTSREEPNGRRLGFRNESALAVPLLRRRQDHKKGVVDEWCGTLACDCDVCAAGVKEQKVNVDTCDESGRVHGTDIDAMRLAPRPLTCRASVSVAEVAMWSSSPD
jgi:hypothetical protein